MEQLIQAYVVAAGVSGASASDRAEFGRRGDILADAPRGEVRAKRFAEELTLRASLQLGNALGSPSKLG
jgi:hypothetical protein